MKAFFAAACTSQKTPLAAQVCAVRAARRLIRIGFQASKTLENE
jgi:hypothetical protein